MTTVGLFATFWPKHGRADELVAALGAVMVEVANEDGTLAYGLHRISGETEGVVVYELYRDGEAQRLHGLSQALADLKQRLPDILDAPPELRPLVPLAGAKGLPF